MGAVGKMKTTSGCRTFQPLQLVTALIIPQAVISLNCWRNIQCALHLLVISARMFFCRLPENQAKR